MRLALILATPAMLAGCHLLAVFELGERRPDGGDDAGEQIVHLRDSGRVDAPSIAALDGGPQVRDGSLLTLDVAGTCARP